MVFKWPCGVLTQLVLVTLAALTINKCQGGIFLGCMQDNNDPRVFGVNPGVYESSAVSADGNICAQECGYIKMRYAAVWLNQFCYCSSTINDLVNVTDPTCTDIDVIKVYTSSDYDYVASVEVRPVSNLHVADISTQVDISFTTSITGYDFPTSTVMTYGDDPYRTEVIPTPDTVNPVHTYIMPGIFTINGQIVDQQSISIPPISTLGSNSYELAITESVATADLSLDCVSRVLVDFDATCKLTINKGSHLSGTIKFGNELTDTITVPSFPWARAGSPVASLNYALVTTTQTGNIMMQGEFQRPGKVSQLEFFAVATGSISFILYRVNDCTGATANYCFTTEQCGATPSCGIQLTCSSAPFCSATGNCNGTCSGRPRNLNNAISSVQRSMIAQYVQTYIIPSTGYNLYTLPTAWDVLSGDRLGFFSSAVVLAARTRSASDGTNFHHNSVTSLPTAGSTIFSTADFVAVNPDVQYQLSATARPAQVLDLLYQFKTSGIQTVTVSLKNWFKPSDPPAVVSKDISVEIPINDSRIWAPEYAVTAEPVSITLLAHSGVDVQYTWSFGDGTVVNTTNQTVSHTYATKGVYMINITSFNPLDEKQNVTTITIQDRVVITSLTANPGMAMEPNPISIVIGGGNDYNCNWTIDGVLATTTAGGVLTYNHIYPMFGNYSVEVTCSNKASSATKIEYQKITEKITGLRFVKKGGPVGISKPLEFAWSTGIDMTFQFQLDSVNRSIASYNFTSRLGETEPILINTVSIITAVLRATNPINDVITVCNMTFDEFITGATMVANPALQANGTDVNFVINMSKGTTVAATIDFGDGLNATFESDLLVPWTADKTFVHAYVLSGKYNVTAVLSNPATGDVVLSKEVIIMSPLGEYILTTDTPFVTPGQEVRVKLNRTSGGEATVTNLTIFWDDGSTPAFTGADVFSETAVHSRTFSVRRKYKINAVITNPLSVRNVSVEVAVMNQVAGLSVVFNPPNTWPTQQMQVVVTVTDGDDVTLTLTPGDLTTPQTFNIPSVTASTSHTFNKAFTTVGTYNVTVTACNPLGCLNFSQLTQVQNKVTSSIKITNDGYVPYPPGNVNFHIGYTAGLPFPTDASYSLDFNAPGLTPQNGSYIQANLPISVSKPLYPGLREVSLLVKNLVSEYTATVMSGSFALLQDPVDLQILYGPAKQPGFGAQKDRFPINTEIYFVTNETLSTVSSAVITYTFNANSSSILTCNRTTVDNIFSMSFNQMGDYQLEIKLINPLSSFTIRKNITIGGAIKGMHVDFGQLPWLPGSHRIMTLVFEEVTDDACICADLGDGDNNKLIIGPFGQCDRCLQENGKYSYANLTLTTFRLPINMTYSKVDDYIIKLTAYNQFDNATYEDILPVSLSKCVPPVISMSLGSLNGVPGNPLVSLRSEKAVIEGIINELACTTTRDNNKIWLVDEIDPEKFFVIRSVNVTTINSWNNTKFTIPPNTLTYGLYKLTFMVVMNRTLTLQTFRARVYSYLQITPTPIRVYVTDGGMQSISKTIGETICLTPEVYSYDPDMVDRTASQGITNWQWYCWGKTESNTNIASNIIFPYPANYTFTPPRTGCFGSGPGKINTTSGRFCFHGSNLVENNTYVIQVTGDKRGITGEGRVEIKVRNGLPSDILITCLRRATCKLNTEGEYAYLEQRINPSDALLLKASCSGPGCSTGSFLWSLLVRNGTDWLPISQNETASFMKGIRTLELSIMSGIYSVFPGKQRYRACLTVAESSFSCLQFFTNSLPTFGSAFVDKTTITAGVDRICANVTNVIDTAAIDNFRFFVKQGNQSVTLGYAPYGYFCSMIPYYDHIQPYCVVIRNVLGGTVETCFANITVMQLNITSLIGSFKDVMKSATSTLDDVIKKGNLQDMNEAFLKTATLINQYSKRDIQSKTSSGKTTRAGTGYGQEIVGPGKNETLEELTPEQKAIYEKNRDERAGVLKLLATNLDEMATNDLDSLEMVSATSEIVAENVDDLPRDGQTAMMNRLNAMTKDLEKLQSEGSKDRVVNIGTTLISGIWNSMTAGSIQIGNGILGDIEHAAETMYYDTDLESSRETFLNAPSLDDAVNGLKSETNTNTQTSTAGGNGNGGVDGINRIRNVLNGMMVQGDNPIEFMSPQGNFYLEKQSADKFSGRNVTPGRGPVVLPDICETMAKMNLNCSDTTKSVTLEVMANPTNVYSYMPTSNADGLPLKVDSEVVSVTFYEGAGGEMAVNNLSKPIEIMIPKDPSFKPEDMLPADPNNPVPKLPPPRLLPGTGGIDTPTEYLYQKLFMHAFELKGKDQSVHFQMEIPNNASCTQFLVVGRLFDMPSLGADGNFTFWGMVPSNTKYCNETADDTEPDPWTFFVDNVKFTEAKLQALASAPDWSKTKNFLYFGVRELRKDEWNVYNATTPPSLPYPYTDQINTTYYLRIYSAGCYNAKPGISAGWDTKGCVVGPLTTPYRTQCTCNHLTSFSGGWIVTPNVIDWDYVFANFDFSKNPTLYAVQISIAILFLLIGIWARRKDLKDIEKLGVTPLEDNEPSDLYLYEVIIDTGLRQRAGTKSNVFFTLAGEMEETGPRKVTDQKRTILQRGNTDRFLMAVPRPLGNLQYVRLWHDNTGKGTSASWYCNYFGILDLQTREKFHFLVNKWFAVEEDDGMLDRLTPIAGPEEMMEFGEMFSRKMKKDLTEDHLWLSIVARPPESRFTRLERVGCCLLLLFLTMVTTCMFYQKEGPAKAGANALTIGPFALTPQQVFVGIISNIITFIPLLLVMELFRRSQLKHGHANKLRLAVEGHLHTEEAVESEKQLEYASRYRSKTAMTSMSDSQHALSSGYASASRAGTGKTPCTAAHVSVNMDESRPSSGTMTTPRRQRDSLNYDSDMSPSKHAYNNVTIDPAAPQEFPLSPENNQPNPNEQPPPKIKKRKLFPWWVRIFSWILLVIGVLVSAAFTTFYGIMFGDLTCKKWLSSMFISFFASVCLTQPIKVIFMAIFFSLLCKKPDKLDEVEFEDEEENLMNELGQKNGLFYDEEYLHEENLMGIKPHRAQYMPPSEADLEKAREYRLKELKMFDVLREILFYVIFFCLLLMVTYSFRDPNAFYLKGEFQRLFVRTADPDLDFTKIRSEAQFWNYTKEIIVPSLRASNWYNNERPLFQRGFLSNRANRLIGYATMRQLRVPKTGCRVFSQMQHLISSCHGPYSMLDEDKLTYGVKWQPFMANGTWNNSAEEFVYQTASTLDGWPYSGLIQWYGGGGYVHQFRGNEQDLQMRIDKLRENNWIDERTRAVFIEFTTYNPNINMFAIVTILFEMPGTGGMWPSYRIEPANLLSFMGSEVKAFEVFCYVMFVFFIIAMIVKESRKLYKLRWAYFHDLWSWCEMWIICSSIGSMAAYAYIMITTNGLVSTFAKYGGNVYMKFQYVGFWNEQLGYVTAFIVFAATIKFIRLLRFNRRMGMLGAVLKYSGKDMRQFFIIFFLIFLAFVIVFYSLFMDALDRYHTFLQTIESSMQIALGKFEFLELYQKEPILGPIVFAAYVIFIIFVMLNMFIAILNEAFAKVRADIDLQSNDYELVSFITTKLILWSGVGNTKIGAKMIKSGVTEKPYRDVDTREMANRITHFSDKVDQLINYINNVYLVNGSDGAGIDSRMSGSFPSKTLKRAESGFDTRPTTKSGFVKEEAESMELQSTQTSRRSSQNAPRVSRKGRKVEPVPERGMTPVGEPDY